MSTPPPLPLLPAVVCKPYLFYQTCGLSQEMMSTAFELYRMQGKYCDAVRIALRMDDPDRLAQLLAECEDTGIRQQMRCFYCYRDERDASSSGVNYTRFW